MMQATDFGNRDDRAEPRRLGWPSVEGELGMAAEEEGEEPKQVEQESDHRTEIVAGSEPTDQRLAAAS